MLQYMAEISYTLPILIFKIKMSHRDKERTKQINFLGILSRYILGYCSNLFTGPYSIGKIHKMDPIK